MKNREQITESLFTGGVSDRLLSWHVDRIDAICMQHLVPAVSLMPGCCVCDHRCQGLGHAHSPRPWCVADYDRPRQQRQDLCLLLV
jgi:hypothetical protein